MSQEKKITLLLYGADRQLWAGGACTLTITKVEPGNAKEVHRQRLAAGTNALDFILKDAEFDQQQTYLFVVTTARHRAAWYAVSHEAFLRPGSGNSKIEVDETILRLMLVPNKTRSTDLPEAYGLMLEAASNFVTKPGLSLETYRAFSPEASMTLLNIEAKLRSTRIGGTPLLSYVQAIRRVDVDRVYLYMDTEAKLLIKDSGDFAGAAGHPAVADLPAHPDSWKQKLFATGNVQLSFSREPENLNGALVCSVDVDIDLERGLRHVMEWLDNNVFKKNKTDQTRVYALLYAQGITPYYKLSQPA